MPDAYIVAANRSPVGRRGGGLSHVHPADLGAHAIRAVIDAAGVDPGAVDDVIFGCVDAMGAQFGNIGRTAWLSAGYPEHVPGTTIDRQCGSSQQAVHFAAQGIMAGVYDLVVAGGVEVMSMVPISSPGLLGEANGMGTPFGGDGWRARYGDQEISQFRGAELISEKWDITREDMERFAYDSHQRALAAWRDGLFEEEVAPYGDVRRDEGPREDTSLEKMAGLSTLVDGGRLTAAAASQISDGAAALLVASADAVERYGLHPLARVHTMTVVGSDPVFMLTGPIPATQAALEKAGMSIDDIDLFEINEAFAPVVLAWSKETGASLERTNVLGGAIALGHPLGATGARLMTTLIHHLRRTGGRYGLQTMCEGGGMANATIVEALS
ncbi:MAG: acetyl-CoA C-acetyltransferase [Actinomycetota bacterium]|jgi:acetyl-CoA C-acetyltransferase|nr:acetyl-CoA C-acetyltransferase [Actinomycetota bacterium]